MWGRTEYPPMVCPPGQVYVGPCNSHCGGVKQPTYCFFLGYFRLDNTMFITSQCRDAQLYHGISYMLVGMFALLAGLALFTEHYHASRRPGYTRSDSFKLNLLVFGTSAGYCVPWIVWGGGHGWVGVIAWFAGSEVALSWMSYTAYVYCCIRPPQGLDSITNAWNGARHRMKTQLIIARVFSCITQVILTPIDCYYRIQHNRDVASITKLLIIASWCSSLGICAWIV
ncbi:hypothetical protein DFS34DRAFT_171714 [Phlyctochytrium arcticum]|nr:hypothetical protein DFS34DRAFT_171714 [Phlyctochytrium arcticum]